MTFEETIALLRPDDEIIFEHLAETGTGDVRRTFKQATEALRGIAASYHGKPEMFAGPEVTERKDRPRVVRLGPVIGGVTLRTTGRLTLAEMVAVLHGVDEIRAWNDVRLETDQVIQNLTAIAGQYADGAAGFHAPQITEESGRRIARLGPNLGAFPK